MKATLALAFPLWISLALTAAVERAPEATPLSIPLKRQAPRQFSEEYARRHLDRLYSKYAPQSAAAAKRKRQTGVSMINSEVDASYIAQISVGTPAQPMDVVLDTGSSDLWLISSTCGNTCGATSPYEESKSSTFEKSTDTTPIQLSYGSGNAEGPLVEDTVSFAGYSVAPQVFIDVTELDQSLVSDSEVSGLLGLAWPGLAQSQSTPFVSALVNANKLPSAEMSFFLTRYLDDPSAQTTEPGGIFTLGGTNSSLYTGSIEYHNIQQTDGQNLYWTLGLSSLDVGSNSISLGQDNTAVIDTGTTLIGGPQAMISEVYAQIPGSAAGTGQMEGYYTYPCSPAVTVSLNFGGQNWAISSDDFEFGQTSQTQCVGAFIELDLGQGAPAWVLGDTFLKNVYTTFRYNPASVGFAALSTGAISQDPEGEAGASGSGGGSAATVSPVSQRSSVPLPSATLGGASSGGVPLFTPASGSAGSQQTQTIIIGGPTATSTFPGSGSNSGAVQLGAATWLAVLGAVLVGGALL